MLSRFCFCFQNPKIQNVGRCPCTMSTVTTKLALKPLKLIGVPMTS